MSGQESWQVSTDAAEIYERSFVPALFAQWPPQVAEIARISNGDRVLDVGCGTGVLAREAAKRVNDAGKVTGLDLNEGMLAVAQRIMSEIEWKRGDAVDLPFDDGSFDAVVSQFAMMYFPDLITSLTEMWRVLVSNGRLAIAIWGPFERATGYMTLTDIAERHCGEAAANVLTAPFILGDESKLADLFSKAGIEDSTIELREGVATYSSIDYFVETEVKGSPLDTMLTSESYQALLNEAREALRPFLTTDGAFQMPMDAYIVSTQKQ